MLFAEAITKRYGSRVVLDGLHFSAGSGEVVAVVGENGAGKSTLLKICAGLLRHDGGNVVRQGRIGYCPQEPGLLGRLTIDEHLRIFGTGMGLAAPSARSQGRALLDALGLPKDEDGRLETLSGGTRQKVNLALAMLGEPEIVLLDEPYQGFDHGTYVNFWDLVSGWRSEGRAVVVITHLLNELQRADRVVELRRLSAVQS